MNHQPLLVSFSKTESPKYAGVSNNQFLPKSVFDIIRKKMLV